MDPGQHEEIRNGPKNKIHILGSFSKLGNVPECLYGDSRRFQNVPEGSSRFLGVCLKTKKGSRSLCGGKTRIHGGRGFLPPPNLPAKEGGESY